jgi:hypothetical protein
MRRRRHPWFWFSLATLGLVTAVSLGIAARSGSGRSAWATLIRLAPSLPEPPVLVFLVGDAERVAAVRRAVDSSRVVAESPGAFLLVEGRLVAATRSDAGPLLTAPGWRDRELEMFAVRPLVPRRRTRAGSASRSADAALTELVNKPTLTWVEARVALAHLE